MLNERYNYFLETKLVEPIETQSKYELLGVYLHMMNTQGESQNHIAAELLVSQPAVLKWFSGESRPRPDKLGILAGINGCNEEELLLLAGLSGYSTEPKAFEKLTSAYEQTLGEQDTIIYFHAYPELRKLYQQVLKLNYQDIEKIRNINPEFAAGIDELISFVENNQTENPQPDPYQTPPLPSGISILIPPNLSDVFVLGQFAQEIKNLEAKAQQILSQKNRLKKKSK